jgi:hypothetical protein
MRLLGLLPAGAAVIGGILLLGAARSHSAVADDVAAVAALDTKYQGSGRGQ